MDELPANQPNRLPPSFPGGPKSSACRTAALRRVRELESSSAGCTDPWVGFSRLVVGDLLRSSFDRQDGVRRILTGVGTAAQRLDRAQDEIGLLLAGSRRVTRLVTIEIERGNGL